MRSRGWLLALCPLLFGFDLLQSPNHAVEAGNARMKAGKAEEALAEYDKAVKELPAEPGAHFNRGAALYSLSRFDEAANEFLRATEAKTTALKAAAFYNLGNSYEQAGKHDDAMAAYRRALTLDPNDIRAKWNLELAQKKKKEEEQKKKNQKPGDKDKDQQNKDDKKDDQAKNDEKKDEQKKDEQKDQNKKDEQKKDEQAQKDQKNDEKKNEQKDQAQKDQKKDEQKKDEGQKQAKTEPQPKPEKGPDMKEIEAVLDSLERSPKDLEKERARLRAIRRAAPSKDW
jgi:Ca-activated chloride channel family protein